MKSKLFSIAAIAALVLSGCSSDGKGGHEPAPEPGETKSAFIKINTRASSNRSDENTASGTEAILYSALIYFLDSSSDPVIYDVRTVATSGGDITLSELEAGVVVAGVPASSTQVYIVGNYNSSDQNSAFAAFPTTAGRNFSDIQATMLDIQQVSYPRIGTGNVGDGSLITVMDGTGALVDFDTTPGGWTSAGTPTSGDFYAVISISPIVARIEIEEITYTGAFQSFTLEAIYINNYFADLPLSLDFTSGTLINNGSVVGRYDPANGSFAYDYYTTMYDAVDEGFTGTGSVTPTNGVWAYQVFSGTDEIPHIILRLSNVVDGSGATIADQYLTINGFLNGSTPLQTLDRNTVYRIANLTFSDDELELVPEPETINVYIQVTVEEWETVDVTPIV